MDQEIQKFVNELVAYIKNTNSEFHYNHLQVQQIVWWIVEKVTGKKRLDFFMGLNGSTPEISIEQKDMIRVLIDRHIKDNYPLQYLLETMQFLGLTLTVQEPILIPRPETEEWVSNFLRLLEPLTGSPLDILDMCTGSGCIGLALAHAYPKARVVLVDKQDHACQLAIKNMTDNAITNACVIKSDLFQALPENCLFDCIVTNPPYIAQSEWHELSSVVKNWEDKDALVSGLDGLDLIRDIITSSRKYLKEPSVVTDYNLPRLIIEIGWQQGEVVRQICLDAGFKRVEIVQDMLSRDRTVICY